MPIDSAKSSVSDFDSSNADNSVEPIEKRSIVDEELERVFEQLKIDTKNQDASRSVVHFLKLERNLDFLQIRHGQRSNSVHQGPAKIR